ncbi:MAG: RNA methyltransferase [Gammaproteobacteria bacterium]|nr:RNA methyltransferase [Gammaproteobacteria bacterium]MDP2142437.1 RNA methyltransferase [Gammaproteobacteria bacterium]MDP2348776.1 RNA methyltransferase [Gammaproteobacteria bacterium]
MNLDDIKKLQQKKYRSEFGFFLAEGEHLVQELEKAAQHNEALQSSELYITERYEHWRTDLKTHLISAKQMAQISDTTTPQGIIALVPMSALLATPPTARERTIYLHEIQDPGNLGTVLRTLAWFGNIRCLLSPDSVDPFNPKVVRASMGAIFHVPVEVDVALELLTERFSRIACLDMEGSSVSAAAFRKFDCYVFGNEARGIPRTALENLGAQPFAIAGSGVIESLNLASVVNMCVYELNRNS